MKKKRFSTTVSASAGRYSQSELNLKSSMADMYASSPYISNQKKRKLVKDLF